jgi:ABC-type Fe3+ transport system substrate-binding protein
MFNADVRRATLEEDWEGKWFSIVARLFPNKLTFHGVRLDGWEGEASPVYRHRISIGTKCFLRKGVPTRYVMLTRF